MFRMFGWAGWSELRPRMTRDDTPWLPRTFLQVQYSTATLAISSFQKRTRHSFNIWGKFCSLLHLLPCTCMNLFLVWGKKDSLPYPITSRCLYNQLADNPVSRDDWLTANSGWGVNDPNRSRTQTLSVFTGLRNYRCQNQFIIQIPGQVPGSIKKGRLPATLFFIRWSGDASRWKGTCLRHCPALITFKVHAGHNSIFYKWPLLTSIATSGTVLAVDEGIGPLLNPDDKVGRHFENFWK